MEIVPPLSVFALAALTSLGIAAGEASAGTPLGSGLINTAPVSEELILIRGGHGRHAGRGHHRPHSGHHRRFRAWHGRAGHLRGRARRASFGSAASFVAGNEAAAIGSEPVFGSSLSWTEPAVLRPAGSVSQSDTPAEVDTHTPADVLSSSISPASLPADVDTRTPADVDTRTPAQGHTRNALDCDRAREVVSEYAFSAVSPTNCSGPIYAFQASRGDTAYAVRLSASTGEITKVEKPAPPDPATSAVPPSEQE